MCYETWNLETACKTLTLLSIRFCHGLFSAVLWQGQECRLTMHYENGFTLADMRTDDSRKTTVIWHFPYEKLRMSADDGMRLLWLDFGEEGEQVGTRCKVYVHYTCTWMVSILNLQTSHIMFHVPFAWVNVLWFEIYFIFAQFCIKECVCKCLELIKSDVK